jgi:hypothetical protein
VRETIDMGGSAVAEIITMWRGNAIDELDAAKELFFAADAVTAKHDLRGPRALEKVREHLGRKIQLRFVQLQAFHFKIHIGTGCKEFGHLPMPASSSVEADNWELWESTGQGDKKGRAADLLHPRIPAKMELNGEPVLLTECIQRKKFLLQRILVEIGEDRLHPFKDRRETVSQHGEFLQAPV